MYKGLDNLRSDKTSLQTQLCILYHAAVMHLKLLTSYEQWQIAEHKNPSSLDDFFAGRGWNLLETMTSSL